MEGRTQKSILILLTNSFAAMNLIHSGLLKKLANLYDIDIMTDMITPKELAHLNKHCSIHVRVIPYPIFPVSPFVKLLRQIQKLLFAQYFRIETERIKQLDLNWFLRFAFQFSELMLPRCLKRWTLKSLRALIIKLLSRALKPDKCYSGVFSTSPFDLRENAVVNAYQKAGVPGLASIISWDNMTSKGVINADHRYVLVWNRLMAEEYERFYSFYKSQTRICISGIPRFDIYFSKNTKEIRSAYRKKKEVPGNRKVILFATGSKKHFADQTYILRDLLEYSEMQPGVDVWLKCHPADNAHLYKSLSAHRNLRILSDSDAANTANFSDWLPPLDFQGTLAAVLLSCDVCVQAASTMRIDAAACGKPVISIKYDEVNSIEYRHSIQRLYEYSHQLPLNTLNADCAVHSRAALFQTLDQLLFYPTPGQLSLIKSFTHFTDARSVDTIVEYVKEWLGC